MTFQPPPPPPPPGGQPPNQPYGAPPPAGPPPAGQWGTPPPAPGYSKPGSGFDPKSVNQLDWGILGAGFLILIFSFFSYYSYSIKEAGIVDLSFDNSAWHGFFGWFGVLLIVIGTAAVAMSIFTPQIKLPAPNRLIGLGAWALGFICILLTLFIYPGSASYNGVSGSLGGSGVDKGHGFSFWLILILSIAGTVVSLMRFQQTGGELPGGLGSKIPQIGHHGSGTTPPPAAPGYGQQPPAAPGYGQQPPPPPGYGPPPQ